MTENTKDKVKEYLRGIVENLPDTPGVYQYFNEDGKIIYVGKAKNLKRRVSSYFNREHDSAKTRILVKKIVDIKYIVVNTETDALLLENNLIKKYKPRYNVLLKDDKTYPSICITNEPFPRVFKTRNIVKGAGTYFGPYSHLPSMNAVLELIKKIYPIRTCHGVLTEENIKANKYKVCLEYHIKNCKAPCVGNISSTTYGEYIKEIKEILKGNTKELQALLIEEMNSLAKELRFEEAQEIKEKYIQLENYRAKSEVVSNTIHNVDVFSIEESYDKNSAFINYLHIKDGAINQAFTFEYKRKLEESLSELLTLGIIEMREKYKSQSKEIVLPFQLFLELDGVKETVPQKGDKRKLLDLSLLNVKQYKADLMKKSDKLNPEQKSVRLMKELQDLLHLPKLPMRIECFDNSNIQGSDAVAGCVVFIKAKPSKKNYRKYNIKTVEGPDDYASMREVITRKYRNGGTDDNPLPDLIITDGGKGQMSAVMEALAEINVNIPVAGLAKDGKHRTSELLFGSPVKTIGIDIKSQLFKLLTNIQDEVHRYAITFHREKRSKRQIASELDNINGIGEKTKATLLKDFKSVKRIKQTDKETLEQSIGKAKAKIVYDYFHKDEE